MRLVLVAAWAMAVAGLSLMQNDTTIVLANSNLTVMVSKARGVIVDLALNGQDLLGPTTGSKGIGPYLDCYCIPAGFYTAGSTAPQLDTVRGIDPSGTSYGGVILSETYAETGQQFQQYWFLREGETGLHTFTRVAYYNESKPFLRNLQELRTLFRPNTDLWTHLSSSDVQTAPLPSEKALEKGVTVQDATWQLNNTPTDAYYTQFSEYFTKYTFSTNWRHHSVHGLYADGSKSNGTTYGAWLVMNTKDTYYGGPLHSDLTVDGIVYNYLVSNHHGETTPNITNGFDRTFGPQYYHFNGGQSATLAELKAEAERLAIPQRKTEFYDSISEHVVGYVPSSRRGGLRGRLELPDNVENPTAVLTADKQYFQDNSADPHAHQYWTDIDERGTFRMDRVKEGNYRLTVYGDGVFGDFALDGISVTAGEISNITGRWEAESAGREIWRLGTPDKSSGEFRHGNIPERAHPLHPPEYLIYWGAYSWQKEFPKGVNYTIGQSDPAVDFNTVHWSVFGPTSENPSIEYDTTNDWTVNFTMDQEPLNDAETATLTIQLAGAKTASGNEDVYNPDEPYSNVALEIYVNDNSQPLTMWIRYNQSSSCIVRSAVSCYQLHSRMAFPAGWLRAGANTLTLHLPYNATGTETAVLPGTVYVQYDAIRLEIS